MSDPAQRGQRRLLHFTPLRYPGGKAKLAPFIKTILKENRLLDGEYVEPYAGSAAIGLELLFHEYVSRIHINDVSKPLHAFWKSVLNHTEEFCRLVLKTPLTVAQWDKQKGILEHAADYECTDIGFTFFFLNRTNRSGILNGGIIGGRDQSGPWKIDARYNAKGLAQRRLRYRLQCAFGFARIRSDVLLRRTESAALDRPRTNYREPHARYSPQGLRSVASNRRVDHRGWRRENLRL